MGQYDDYLEAARLKGTHTREEWRQMKRVYHGCCVRCLKKAWPKNILTKDHVIPVSLGGSDSITNLQPLCETCNNRKGNKIIDYRIGKIETPPEWLQAWAAGMTSPQYVTVEGQRLAADPEAAAITLLACALDHYELNFVQGDHGPACPLCRLVSNVASALRYSLPDLKLLMAEEARPNLVSQ
ncbi:MAG: HNH endonuclease [Blastocatellia bacterium]